MDKINFLAPSTGTKNFHFSLFSQGDNHKYLGLLYRLEELERVVELLITVAPTPIALMMDPQWDVPENSTIPMTQPSSQSDQADTKSGLVEQDCKCAAPAPDFDNTWVGKDQWNKVWTTCKRCSASLWYGRIPAQGVDTTLSTLAK